MLPACFLAVVLGLQQEQDPLEGLASPQIALPQSFRSVDLICVSDDFPVNTHTTGPEYRTRRTPALSREPLRTHTIR